VDGVGAKHRDRVGAVAVQQLGQIQIGLPADQQARAGRDQQLDTDRKPVQRAEVGVGAHQRFEVDAVAVGDLAERLARGEDVAVEAGRGLGRRFDQAAGRLPERDAQHVARVDQDAVDAVGLLQRFDRQAVERRHAAQRVARADRPQRVAVGPRERRERSRGEDDAEERGAQEGGVEERHFRKPTARTLGEDEKFVNVATSGAGRLRPVAG